MPNRCEYTKLIELADACNNGACNPAGIIRSFAGAVTELPPGQVRANPAVKCVLGQLSYLCGEGLGPTPEAIEEYNQWKEWAAGPQTLTWPQARAIHAQRGRWAKIGEPTTMVGGNGAIALAVSYESGEVIYLAIEPDGYVHS